MALLLSSPPGGKRLTKFMFALCFIVLPAACSSFREPAPETAFEESVRSFGDYAQFYLVEAGLWRSLESYLAANPGIQPESNADGTFRVPGQYSPPGTVVLGVRSLDDSEPARVDGFVVLRSEPALPGRAVIRAEAVTDEYSGQSAVMLVFGDFRDADGTLKSGRELLYRLTSRNKGKYLALVVENRVVKIAMIREAIESGAARIFGNCSRAEADKITAILNGDPASGLR